MFKKNGVAGYHGVFDDKFGSGFPEVCINSTHHQPKESLFGVCETL